MTPSEAAEKLKNGETLRMNFENKTKKHDFDYEVLKKLIILYEYDMQASSRALIRLISRPIE